MERIEFNIETQELLVIPLTAEEIEQAQANSIAFANEKINEEKAEKEKANSKASALAKLSALGLTDDEIKALVG